VPQVWLAIPTGTPPELERFRDEPERLEAFVKQVVEDEEVGAHFVSLHFDVGRPVAYALVENLDNYITLKAVCRILGAEYIKKLITPQQAAEMVELERRIRGRLEQY
jgi:hypothetical protein